MFEGIYPPISTPFENGDVSFAKLEANLDRWLETDLTGFVVAGSNGEGPYLTFEERVRLTAAVRKKAANRRVIVGTGRETTEETVTATRACADAGADAVLVLPPHFFRGNMTHAVLRRHFEAVADASPVPVLLYNMPRNTSLNLDPDLIVQLSHHPNVSGIKDSGGDIVQISEVVRRTDPAFEVFAGSGSFLLPALVMGAKGGMMALANVLPEACCSLYALALSNRLDVARRVQQLLLPANAAVTSSFGVPGLKAAMDGVGLFGGEPRPPLQPLNEGERLAVIETIRTAQREFDALRLS